MKTKNYKYKKKYIYIINLLVDNKKKKKRTKKKTSIKFSKKGTQRTPNIKELLKLQLHEEEEEIRARRWCGGRGQYSAGRGRGG